MSDLRKQLEDALFALPRPVAAEDVRSTAIQVLGENSQKANEFSRWMDANGDVLLRRING